MLLIPERSARNQHNVALRRDSNVRDHHVASTCTVPGRPTIGLIGDPEPVASVSDP